MRHPSLALAAAAAVLSIPGTAPSQDGKPPAPGGKKIQVQPAMRIAAPRPQPEPTQAELKARFEKKLAGAWLKNADWNLDWDAARAKAKETGRKVFAYFTRSYAP